MGPFTIAVASGKGGTGKTTVAANLVLSLPDAEYIDCDVETPNGHLFLRPDILERRDVTSPLPQIDPARCTLCGDCAQACEFNALAVLKDRVLVFAELCHGCGVCRYVCPEEGAIVEVQRAIGSLEIGEISDAADGPAGFVQGTLNVGETASVALIKAVKRQADPSRTRILDASAGTACPMVETLHGADYCLLVTEPTPFGLNDLELAVAVARRLGVPCGVVLNRCDIGDRAVTDYCRAQDIPVLMEIPFERALAAAYARGITWVEADPAWKPRFQTLFQGIEKELGA
jgi:MinD superfamily P-loop ATPase